MSFTPGPWAVAKNLACFDGKQVISILSEAENGDMVVWPSGFRNTENAKANARLIAAAPALLELAEAIFSAAKNGNIANTSDEDSVGVLLDAARTFLAAVDKLP